MTPPTDLRRRLQRELMWLVLGIVIVDALAIGAYSVLEMNGRAGGTRLGFTIAWVAATLAVVVPRLQRIKGLRAQVRRGHGGR
ncbi:MAG TPA: hypothetical protein VEA99_03040 [Gemmatimonadaceae bacterium]|nr:hypothetical protein [Gemmatimonadaceae bacterium]